MTGIWYVCCYEGPDGGQKSLQDYDWGWEGGAPLLADLLLSETLPVDSLEEGKVLYLPLQKIRASIFGGKVIHYSSDVHNLS